MAKHRSTLFLFLVSFMYVGLGAVLVEAKIWRAEELAVGVWDVTLRGGWFFDPSRIFPRNNHNPVRSAMMSISGDGRRRRRRRRQDDTFPMQRRPWGSSMDCCLSIGPDGTFVLTPGGSKKSSSSLSSSSFYTASSSGKISQRLALQGQWDVLSNPYCITDRFYDQLQLQSYPRTTVLARTTSDAGRGSSSSPAARRSSSLGSLDLSCRMWGRFAKSKTIGRKGSMTHGTMVWRQDDPKQCGPRRIVASFSAKRVSNEPNHEGWEDQEFFGY